MVLKDSTIPEVSNSEMTRAVHRVVKDSGSRDAISGRKPMVRRCCGIRAHVQNKSRRPERRQRICWPNRGASFEGAAVQQLAFGFTMVFQPRIKMACVM